MKFRQTSSYIFISVHECHIHFGGRHPFPPIPSITKKSILEGDKGIDPFFLNNFGINYFFFFGEKVSSGICEMCPKILGATSTRTQQMGAYYIYNCMYHIIIVIISKYIVNQKILTNKMCLEFNFTYAMQISLRSIWYYIYIWKTIIVIISKNKSKIKKFSQTKCA